MTALPETMTAIAIVGKGGPEVLQPTTVPVPLLGRGQVLIKVAAAGVNRPDVMQRSGLYPAPKGHSEIPGPRGFRRRGRRRPGGAALQRRRQGHGPRQRRRLRRILPRR